MPECGFCAMANDENPAGRCENCGTRVRFLVGYCPQCGEAIRPPVPRNYLVESLLSLVLCCFPLSVIAIWHAARVDDLYQAGDYAGALRASKTASKLVTASVAAGLFLYFGLVVGTLVYAIVSDRTERPSEFFMTGVRLQSLGD
jgi:hypothetical protein